MRRHSDENTIKEYLKYQVREKEKNSYISSTFRFLISNSMLQGYFNIKVFMLALMCASIDS